MDVLTNSPWTLLVANFGKRHLWLPKNILIGIGTEPPDPIVYIMGDPDGSRKKYDAKERGESEIQSDSLEVHYRKADKKEERMEIHVEVTNKDTRKLTDEWKKEVKLPE